MDQLTITVDGDGAWPDLAGRQVVLGQWTHLSAFTDGAAGALAIGLRVELPDGRVCYTETSWALLYVAAQAIAARYGAPASLPVREACAREPAAPERPRG